MRAVSLPGPNGPRRSPMRSGVLKVPAMPTPARLTTCTGWRRWSVWFPKRASPRRQRSIAIAKPGITPPIARRTAGRSKSRLTTSPDRQKAVSSASNSMQLHDRRGAYARGDQTKQGPAAAVKSRLVHLVERAIHQAGEEARDQTAGADERAHQAADRAVLSQGHRRAEIMVDEFSQELAGQQMADLLDHEIRLLMGCLRPRRNILR